MPTFTLHRLPHLDGWHRTVSERLVEHLRSQGHSLQIQDTSTFELRFSRGRRQALPLRDSLCILEDGRTGALRALDFHDWPDPFDVPELIRDVRLRVLLRCQYREDAFRGARSHLIQPWTYFENDWPLPEQRLEELRRRRRTEPRLHFRGHLWKEREPVVRILQRRGVLGPDVERVPPGDYLEEMTRHRLVLSLPGMGEVCHRDIEAFAVGSCVLRLQPRNRFHDELRPDHHFVSVPANVDRDPPEVVAEHIERRFHQVIQNAGYLGFVAHNAQQWYDRNVRWPASMRLTEALLDLER